MNPQEHDQTQIPRQTQLNNVGHLNQPPVVASGLTEQPIVAASQPSKKSKKMLIAGVASLLIIGVAAGIFFLSKGSNTANTLEQKSGSVAQQVQDSDDIDVNDQKNKVALVQSFIVEMAANNRGVLPTSTQEFNDYIDSTRQADTLRDTIVAFKDSFNTSDVPNMAGTIYVYPSHTCEGTAAVTGSNRQVAFMYATNATAYACESY